MSQTKRAARVRLPHRSGISLVFPDLASPLAAESKPLELEVENLSSSGVGFRWPAELQHLPLGSLQQVKLLLEKKTHAVSLRWMRTDGSLVGCRFEAPPATLTKAIDEFFRAELQAMEMLSAKREAEKADPEWMTYWFTGKNHFEVYFSIHPKTLAISKYTVSYFGCYLKGGEGLSFRAGDTTQAKDSMDDPEVRAAFIRRVERLLENVRGLNPEHRRALVELVRRDASSR
jgi:hypothetical protein